MIEHLLLLIVVSCAVVSLNLAGQPVGRSSHQKVRELFRPTGPRGKVLEQAWDSWMPLAQKHYGDPAVDQNLLEMADAPLISTTTGVLNKIFGRYMWSQLNQTFYGYASLPKVQARKGAPYGWRAKSAFASTGKGGQSQGTIPDSVLSTYLEVAPTIKEHTTVMQVSGLQQDLADGPDDAYGALVEVASELATEHGKQFERALNTDVDTLASNNIESIDRITASSANQATIGWTAGDEDIYGIDRSANTAFDAVQTVAATATALTLKELDSLFRQVMANGGTPVYWLTGWDTWESISDLLEPRGRWEMGIQQLMTGSKQGEADVTPGTSIASFVNRYQGLPIIASDQVVADSNELSRAYLLDTSNPEGAPKPRLGVDVLRPTEFYLEGERSTRGPKSVGYAGDFATAITRHEVVCRFFKAQAQLRDRTAP